MQVCDVKEVKKIIKKKKKKKKDGRVVKFTV